MHARRVGSYAPLARRSVLPAGALALVLGLSACGGGPTPPGLDATAPPPSEAALVAAPGSSRSSTPPAPTASTEAGGATGSGSSGASTAAPRPGVAGRVASAAARLRRERPTDEVLTSAATVVAGPATAASLREVAAAGDEAWRRCRAVWPAAEDVPPLVVVLASSPETAGEAPGTPTGARPSSAPVEAVATTVVAGRPPSARVRVHLDPRGWAALTEKGRRVVLTHECVHVALAARARPAAPAWLVEGTAEYVAYRDAAVRREEVLAPLFARVAREGAPASFPADADFEVGHGDLTQVLGAYAEASSAAAVYADLYGEPALLRLVTTGPGAPGPGSFRELEAVFLPQWRHELQQAALRSTQL